MKLTIVGTGYVGIVTGAVFADLGHQVWGLDLDKQRIAGLKKGKIPFFEPGLEKLVKKGLRSKRLRFTTSYSEAVPPAEVVFICVGTPPKENGETDLSYLLAAVKSLAPHLSKEALVVIKSTVPPNTNRLIKKTIRSLTNLDLSLVSCPEFLSEGSAVKNTRHPERVVIGAEDPQAIEKLIRLHQGIGGKRIVCSPQSAQLIKYAANVFLGIKISFANLLAEVCEKYQADVEDVVEGVGADPRIGRQFLGPGLGFGGSCLPKDLDSFSHWAGTEVSQGLFKTVQSINQRQIDRAVAKAKSLLGRLNGKTVALLGLAFKPNTDDLREAPSLKLIEALLAAGARLQVYDPAAMAGCRRQFPNLTYGTDPYQAVTKADLLILVTEWEEFQDLDWVRIKTLMNEANVIDGRNLWPAEKLKKLGFKYQGFGK